MEGEDQIYDKELGCIRIQMNVRAKNMTFRATDYGIGCTVPPGTCISQVVQAIGQMRGRLLMMKQREAQRRSQRLFGPESRIDAEGFTFRCMLDDKKYRQLSYSDQCVTYIYHSDEDWASPQLQTWLTNGVEEFVRLHAYGVLLPRLEQLAKQRGLHYNKVTIRKTKSRWGSCTAQGNINLSLYLALLPQHLRDYIMHHELTHLLEMNHGPRFHALLNEAVGGRSAALKAEMKLYAPELQLR